jgi:hypothetical protein
MVSAGWKLSRKKHRLQWNSERRCLRSFRRLQEDCSMVSLIKSVWLLPIQTFVIKVRIVRNVFIERNDAEEDEKSDSDQEIDNGNDES